jgi:hypothetical protein
MPIGSFTFGQLPPAQSSPAVPVLVCMVPPVIAGPGASALNPLPNIVCVRIDERAGPFPPTAQFTYLLDDTMAFNFGWPSQVEQILPVDALSNPYVVQNDDRIVVFANSGSGLLTTLFDGFAQIPQSDVTPDSQSVSFTAVGAAARCWDAPLKGSLRRNGNTPNSDPATGPIKTDLPCRFNPADTSLADGNKGGINPNCTPLNQDVGEGNDTTSYPVFLTDCATPAPGFANPETLWTLSMACRYIMSVGNAGEPAVDNPDFSALEDLLQAYSPPAGSDISSLATDQTADIVIRDYDASDKAWPDALAELLSYGGFSLAFVVSSSGGENGLPSTTLKIYRNDALTTISPKQVYLQPAGGTLGNGPNNAFAFHIARDCNNIVNSYSVESPLKHVEVSFILVPLYAPSVADYAPGPAGRGQYLKSSWTPATTGLIRQKYRWYGVDELGEGYWDGISFVLNTPYNFSGRIVGRPGVFPDNDAGVAQFVIRRRPGAQSLISLDSLGNPLKADLSISFNYNGLVPPTTWDGSATWTKINGGWSLLPDRLGVVITVDDLDIWDPGATGNKLSGLSWWSNPTAAGVIPTTFAGQPCTPNNSPYLRLTTVIEDDRMLSAIAGKRSASPTQFTRHRRVDAHDHFQFNRVFANSLYNQTKVDVIARDDTPDALAHAVSLRSKTEFPPTAGSITLPFLTTFYGLGDRISEVDGRNINFQMNTGVSQGEQADFPFIVGRSFILQPHQETMIQLGDHRAEAVNL